MADMGHGSRMFCSQNFDPFMTRNSKPRQQNAFNKGDILLWGIFVWFSSFWLPSRLFSYRFISDSSLFLSSWTVTADHFGSRWIYFQNPTCWETPHHFSCCFCHSSSGHTRVSKGGGTAVAMLGSWGAARGCSAHRYSNLLAVIGVYFFSSKELKKKKFANSSF